MEYSERTGALRTARPGPGGARGRCARGGAVGAPQESDHGLHLLVLYT